MSIEQTKGPAGWARLIITMSVAALMASFLTVVPAATFAGPDVGVIVRTTDGAGNGPETLVETLGGSIGQPLDLIGGFSATIPTDAIAALQASPDVVSVVPDGVVHLLKDRWIDATEIRDNYEPEHYAGSMYWVTRGVTQADEFWKHGYTGAGVDIALIDSGVVAVNGLSSPDKVVNALDLSFDSQAENLRYLDTFGHGTHLAGIIAGRDDGISTETIKDEAKKPKDHTPDYFLGMAPGARIINVKVADHEGAVDVSQVIAAIDWVVQHRFDDGMNIRVVNLSFGTDSTQAAVLDPLAFAVEQAWKQGIVVVVAAGNDGNTEPLRDPAYNPYVIAVGATVPNGTAKTDDDPVATYSNCGTDERHVDVLAPGSSLVSLRNPGSHADENYPTAQIADRFFLGSGSSQAAAVVSGAVALIIEQRPEITPDEVKELLVDTAQKVKKTKGSCKDVGLIDLKKVWKAATPKLKDAEQKHPNAKGTGTLEGARGSDHLTVDGVVLAGETDVFGTPWDSETWAGDSAAGSTWSGTSWSGTSWSGTSWSGTSWSGTSWSDYGWSGTSWSGTSWSGTSWSGTSWSGTSWTGSAWTDDVWAGLSWG